MILCLGKIKGFLNVGLLTLISWWKGHDNSCLQHVKMPVLRFGRFQKMDWLKHLQSHICVFVVIRFVFHIFIICFHYLFANFFVSSQYILRTFIFVISKCFLGHTEKVYFVRYHPLASGVLASGSYDMSIKIWDLDTASECIQLKGHTDTV